MKTIPGFHAEASLGTCDGVQRQRRRSKSEDRALVVPQLRLNCGNTFLTTTCTLLAASPAVACVSWFFWNPGAAVSCTYGLLVAHAPWCAPCTVINV